GGSTLPEISVTPTQTTSYQCTISDPNTLCTTTESVKVWIIYDFLFVANSFHPTADFPQIAVHAGIVVLPLSDLNWSIYDRWGEKIFQSTDVNMGVNNTGWDGRFRGKQCPTGVYVYTLT